ncbi:peptidyl-tRNA hydrolase [Trametes versicolor FP-101664 SS1]|uniref:peptidyl-tRNA hydrolase n=1 Tax=Trametes versicolor (strain FP-101664) TaxID=717944 RepID=UPI0004623649|nr:peptidyl-tRNA hydrolase [Trametes versicolor FP-101664 SS1]EIW63264.1 peptidyl-tRNA hydrolase [Trametes versicolor FP-101664 SS1]
MASPHFLIAGLGNITHPMTRHSIGHYIVDALASRLGIRLSSDRAGYAARTDVQIGPDTVTLTLFKPKALMNISGQPVVQTLQNTAIKPENLIVVHDSLDHKPCTLSPKFGGSANGHNGVRSVIAALGGEAAFHRLRAGVGRDGDPADYVLGPLSPQERQFWGPNGSGADLVWRELTRVIEKSLKSR